MVRVLGALQRLQRGGVLGLPLEPTRQARERIGLARAAALDAERTARGFTLRMRQPLPVALGADQPKLGVTDRDLFHQVIG
jgi:hypothetical protein